MQKETHDTYLFLQAFRVEQDRYHGVILGDVAQLLQSEDKFGCLPLLLVER